MSRANEHISSLVIITSRRSLESSFTYRTLEVPGLGSPLISPYTAHSNKPPNGQNGGFKSQAELSHAWRARGQQPTTCEPNPVLSLLLKSRLIRTQVHPFLYVLAMAAFPVHELS